MSKKNSIRIKVCGMREPINSQQVAALGPDYMGFIFYRNSKRYVGDGFVLPAISDSIARVGVFVNETTAEIIRLSKMHSISHVQLHGHESPMQCKELKGLGYIVIKAFSVSIDFDFKQLRMFEDGCDYFLFDTKGENFGGNGKSFDWRVLTSYNQEVPFFLSGGLSLTNCEAAFNLSTMNLHALDVNTGFETEPGLKNISDLKRLFELRRGLYTYV